jgi:hypothetical protein
MTADSIIGTSGRTYAYTGGVATNIVSSALTSRNEVTVSFYLKYKGLNRIRVMYGNTTSINTYRYITVDLENGIITDNSSNITNPFIESVGEGWYRVGFSSIMNVGTTNNRFAVGLGDTTKTIADDVDGVYMWGAQLVDGDQAKGYFRVTNGFNIPVIEYDDSDCPSLLIQAQMTNSWTNNNVTAGYTTNTSTVKGATIYDAFGDGFDGFEYTFIGGLQFIAASTNIRVFNTLTFPYQRLSLYIKNPSSDFFGIHFTNVAQVIFKFSTLEVSDSTLGSIKKINDDTYALYIHNDNAAMGPFSQVRVAFVTSLTNDNTLNGSAILGLGFFQQSSVSNILPDVYGPIVTNTGAVTRNGDFIYRDGIEDLIGQTEGSIFCEFSVKYNRNWNSGIFMLRATSTTDERIALGFNNNPSRPSGGYLNLFIVAGGAQAVDLNSGLIPSPNQRYKVCATYNQTSQKIYVNGELLATRVGSYSQPGELQTLQLGGYGSSTVTNGNINMYSGLVFKNVLSDTEAINLTTL